MDFGQAAILTFIFLGLVSEAKSLVWGTNKERITVAIVNVVAVITVFLVATSAWADTQIIGGKNLGALGWSSELLVAIVLGGSASGLWQGLESIRNIGENQSGKSVVKVTDLQRYDKVEPQDAFHKEV